MSQFTRDVFIEKENMTFIIQAGVLVIHIINTHFIQAASPIEMTTTL